MYSVLNCHNVAKHIEFYLGQLWFNVTSTYKAADECFKKIFLTSKEHTNILTAVVSFTPQPLYPGKGSLNTHWMHTNILTGVVSFTPQPLYPGKRSLKIHWIGGWVDSRTGLDYIEK
jgi:hypothetical protein